MGGESWGFRVAATIAVLVLAAFAPACSGSKDASSATTTTLAVVGGDQSYLIRAISPQVSDGTSLLVDSVAFADSDGYAVAYADGGGAPGVQLGVSALLHHGMSHHVTVPLDPAVARPGTVYVILHLEDNGDQTFDYPAGDQPAQLGSGIVVTPVQLVVP